MTVFHTLPHLPIFSSVLVQSWLAVAAYLLFLFHFFFSLSFSVSLSASFPHNALSMLVLWFSLPWVAPPRSLDASLHLGYRVILPSVCPFSLFGSGQVLANVGYFVAIEAKSCVTTVSSLPGLGSSISSSLWNSVSSSLLIVVLSSLSG